MQKSNRVDVRKFSVFFGRKYKILADRCLDICLPELEEERCGATDRDFVGKRGGRSRK